MFNQELFDAECDRRLSPLERAVRVLKQRVLDAANRKNATEAIEKVLSNHGFRPALVSAFHEAGGDSSAADEFMEACRIELLNDLQHSVKHGELIENLTATMDGWHSAIALYATAFAGGRQSIRDLRCLGVA